MRSFSLIDEIGNTYNLTVSKASFLSEPDGLGFARDSSYARVGGAFVRVGKDLFEQATITGNVIFKGYTLYPGFTAYILSGKELRLQYSDGNGQTYLRDVDVQSLGKGELNTAGLLILPIEFACKSRWYQVLTTTFTDSKDVLVNNNSLLPASWRLTVTVAANQVVPGQTVELYKMVNGNRVTLTKISLDKPNRRNTLVWNTRDGHASCIWNGENMVPVMDFTVDNFFKIPVGEHHFSIYGFSGGLTSGTLEVFKEWETV